MLTSSSSSIGPGSPAAVLPEDARELEAFEHNFVVAPNCADSAVSIPTSSTLSTTNFDQCSLTTLWACASQVRSEIVYPVYQSFCFRKLGPRIVPDSNLLPVLVSANDESPVTACANGPTASGDLLTMVPIGVGSA
jgi:hypothetical protein